MQTGKVDGRKLRPRISVERVRALGQSHPDELFTTQQLRERLEMNPRTLERALAELKQSGEATIEVWWTQGGKRARWTFS